MSDDVEIIEMDNEEISSRVANLCFVAEEDPAETTVRVSTKDLMAVQLLVETVILTKDGYSHKELMESLEEYLDFMDDSDVDDGDDNTDENEMEDVDLMALNE